MDYDAAVAIIEADGDPADRALLAATAERFSRCKNCERRRLKARIIAAAVAVKKRPATQELTDRAEPGTVR